MSAKSGLRPPKSKTPITSIAGLKKAIDEMWYAEDKRHKVSDFKAGLEECLELINSFEVSVRERIRATRIGLSSHLIAKHKRGGKCPIEHEMKLKIFDFYDIIGEDWRNDKELRRILGEGAE